MARRRFVALLVLGLLVVSASAGIVSAAAPPARAAGFSGAQLTLPTAPPPTSATTSPSSASSSSSTSSTSSSSTSTTSSTLPPAGDGSPVVGVVPPADLAIVNSVKRTPPGSTLPMIAALSGLTALGFTPVQAAVLGFGRFPVAGPATFADDWLMPRFAPDGSFRFHEGNDIVAACATPIRASAEGTLLQGSDPAGGNNAQIVTPDGSYLYMAHLSAYPPGQTSGQHVTVGEVIGFVGRTGAATGCHLHFEIHPRGGPAVDPKPFLDAWAAEAQAAAPLLVGALRADRGLPAVAPRAPSPPPPTSPSPPSPVHAARRFS